MQLTCPCCAARFSLDAVLADEAARAAVAAALKLPAPLGDLILRYLAFFRPEKRALTWDRAARLLTELQAAIAGGQVERHGRAWAAPHEAWRAALEQMIESRDRLTLPLKSHGYLYEIVAGLANKAQGVAEKKHEQQKGYRYHREQSARVPQTVADVIDRAAGHLGAAKLKEAFKK